MGHGPVQFAESLPVGVPGLAFTGIRKAPGGTILTWSGGPATVRWGPSRTGPWSSLTNAESPCLLSPTSGFFSLVQDQVEFTAWPVPEVTGKDALYYDKRPFAGDNEVAFLAHGDGVTRFDGQGCTFIPLSGAIPYPEHCATDCVAYDSTTQRLFTFHNQCVYGQGGPFTFAEYQMTETSATLVAINRDEFGTFGDTMGDMMRTAAGGIVVCWKSPQLNYAFQYRSPSGQWQPVWHETNIEQRVSHLRLGQHPDGSIMCFISRDGIHDPVPTVKFVEIGDQLAHVWTKPTFTQEGEFPVVTSITDHRRGTLTVTRPTDPVRGFNWQEGFGFRKGSAFGVVDVHSDGTTNDSPKYPTYDENYSEPVATHASMLCDGTLWVVLQEWNPIPDPITGLGCFSLVHATKYRDGQWGDKAFLYENTHGGNFRGGAHCMLSSYYNSAENPTWALFANIMDGRLHIFEISR